MINSNDEFLKSKCNRYTNGFCHTLACLKRGGYKGGSFKDDIATCEYHEVVQELEDLRDELRCVNIDLNRALDEM